jgi:NAD+ kinase
MKIALFSNAIKKEHKSVYEHIFSFFEKNSVQLLVEEKMVRGIEHKFGISLKNIETYSRNKQQYKADIILSVGGDGTFISAIYYALANNIPVAGINCGRLGFLADIHSENTDEALSQLIAGDYTVEERTMLQIYEPANMFDGFTVAVNEITVHKLDNSSMIKIDTIINGEYLAGYWADGLIISTPTGSTAYSLSVGGPIVMPNLEGLIITPIASHNLTVRPVVVPNNVEIELHIDGRGSQFLVSSDHRSQPLDFSTRLIIKKATKKVAVIKLKNHSFYSTLRNKLMWGADKRN